MIPARIGGCTRALGAPRGWNPETDGHCGMLPIRDEMRDDMPTMTSAWEPTPDELAALNDGAKVMLRVVGAGHPPVMIYVGDSPRDTDRSGEADETAKQAQPEARAGAGTASPDPSAQPKDPAHD